MALSPAFLDELRARTPIAAVIGRKVKLARSGRNMKGNCPFHNEKTPSFYVYEDGYHCFGCGAHGDAVSFVMQSQGLGFIEAVEQLAGEAGLDVPKPSPEAAEAEQRRLGLAEVLVRAEAFFRARLFLPEGKAGLEYLRKRGLSDETISRFGLGWSGDGRGALGAELARDGISAEQLLDGGLLRETESGERRELFFNRVMFPIRDRRGAVISFGGRILGDGQPKYVNGPETALFSKRRNLYALDLARAASREGAVVTVVEGYMDVIALHQAGFAGAVAPLGTALTEEQLTEIWRISPAPVLCFDGDEAGGRATERAILTALPLLDLEKSLGIVRLENGEDPDSFIQKNSHEQFKHIITHPQEIKDAIYSLFRQNASVNTDVQRAQFAQKLEDTAKLIQNRNLRWEFISSFRELQKRDFSSVKLHQNRSAWGRRPGFTASGLIPRRPAVPRIPPSDARAGAERGRILLAILLRHPRLLRDVDHALEELALPEGLTRVQRGLLTWMEASDVLDSAGLMSHLTESGLASDVAAILSTVPAPLPACAAPDAMPGEAEAGWWHFFGLLNRGRLEEEVAAAGRYFAAHGDDRAAEQRLIALARARETLNREQGEAEA